MHGAVKSMNQLSSCSQLDSPVNDPARYFSVVSIDQLSNQFKLELEAGHPVGGLWQSSH